MALVNPLKAILTTNTVFRPFGDSEVDVKLPKLIFVGLQVKYTKLLHTCTSYICFSLSITRRQVLSLVVALYKCSTMGLLPLTSGDWTAYIPQKSVAEVTASLL